jgi:hypothetical protein
MNDDTNFIFEAYKASSTHGTPIHTNPTGAPGPKPGYDAIQNTINKKMKAKSFDPMSDIEQKRKGRRNIGSVRTEDAESSTLAKAMHAAATELDQLKTCSEIIKDVASKHDVDPVELARELKAAGAIDENDLKSVHSHSEDAEEGMHCSYAKKGCKCSKCQECEDNQTMSEDA